MRDKILIIFLTDDVTAHKMHALRTASTTAMSYPIDKNKANNLSYWEFLSSCVESTLIGYYRNLYKDQNK